MVMAENYPAAIKASGLVKVSWTSGPTAAVDEAEIQNHARALIADQAAVHVGIDPLSFRLGLLTGAGRNSGVPVNDKGGSLRQANVLLLVAEKAGWGTPLPARSARGIATSFGQEHGMPTWVACVAEVAVDSATGSVNVKKLTMFTDAGSIIDPDSARAQTERAML